MWLTLGKKAAGLSFAVLAGIFFAFVSPAGADFENNGFGARQTALGAFVGLSDDVYAIWYNPAGIAKLARLELSSTYRMLYSGLTGSPYMNLAAGTNLEPGISESVFCLGFPFRKLGAAGVGWQRLSLGEFYSEDIFNLSFAKPLSNRLYGGVTLKIFSKKYGSDAYTRQLDLFAKNGYTKTAFSLDLSAMLILNRRWTAGVAAQELLMPNTGLAGLPEDHLPMKLAIGLANRTVVRKLAFDLVSDVISSRPVNVKFNTGIEYLVGGRFFLCTTAGVGKGGRYNFACGFGIQLARWLRCDYTFVYPVTGIKSVYTHSFEIDLQLEGP